MAISHLQFNDSFHHGRLLRSGLSIETARENLIKARDVMQMMIDGDELNSALSKLTTDAQVSSVQAALLQLFSKLR